MLCEERTAHSEELHKKTRHVNGGFLNTIQSIQFIPEPSVYQAAAYGPPDHGGIEMTAEGFISSEDGRLLEIIGQVFPANVQVKCFLSSQRFAQLGIHGHIGRRPGWQLVHGWIASRVRDPFGADKINRVVSLPSLPFIRQVGEGPVLCRKRLIKQDGMIGSFYIKVPVSNTEVELVQRRHGSFRLEAVGI